MEDLKAACSNKNFKSFKDLAIGEHLIEKFSIVNTSFGDRVRVDLKDCFMFLPERFMTYLDGEAIKKLNESNIMMSYKGRNLNNNRRLNLDFEAITAADGDKLIAKPVEELEPKSEN